MKLKNLWYYPIALALLLTQVPRAAAITTSELADIIEQMETAIVDISMEYEEHIIPPSTHEEGKEKMGFDVLISKDGYMRYKFSAARLLPEEDPNAMNWDGPGLFFSDLATTLVTKEGNSWEAVTKQSYNGQIGKEFKAGSWPPREDGRGSGLISLRRPSNFGTATPLGFSVLNLAYSGDSMSISDRLLSARLRAKDRVRLDNVERTIDGFNTIRADLLTSFVLNDGSRLVYMRIYFSVDHDYTPVKFENMKGRGKVAFTRSVGSLEKVSEGVWFPGSGIITTSDSDRVNAYQAISPILVNQGFKDDHFDIDFPVGTKVHDKVQDKDYIVK